MLHCSEGCWFPLVLRALLTASGGLSFLFLNMDSASPAGSPAALKVSVTCQTSKEKTKLQLGWVLRSPLQVQVRVSVKLTEQLLLRRLLDLLPEDTRESHEGLERAPALGDLRAELPEHELNGRLVLDLLHLRDGAAVAAVPLVDEVLPERSEAFRERRGRGGASVRNAPPG